MIGMQEGHIVRYGSGSPNFGGSERPEDASDGARDPDSRHEVRAADLTRLTLRFEQAGLFVDYAACPIPVLASEVLIGICKPTPRLVESSTNS